MSYGQTRSGLSPFARFSPQLWTSRTQSWPAGPHLCTSACCLLPFCGPLLVKHDIIVCIIIACLGAQLCHLHHFPSVLFIPPSDRCMHISAAALSPVGWELMRREVAAAERLKKGALLRSGRSQPLGLGHTKADDMSPDTLTRFCCLDAAYYFEEFVILVTSSNNWLQGLPDYITSDAAPAN